MLVLGMAVGSYFNGILVDRMNISTFLSIQGIIGSLLFSLIPYLCDVWFLNLLDDNLNLLHNILFGLYFLCGILYSAIYPAANAAILNWIDHDYAGRVLTFWVGSFNIGGILFYQFSYYL